jgi:FkbM family methyltransferase
MNEFLRILQRLKFYSVIKVLARIGYKKNGKHLEKVHFDENLNAWIYTLNGFHFVSRGPGWVQDFDFLFDNLKKYSGYHYWPTKSDVIIDIGAGVGEESLAFAKLVGPTGKIFAIEAHPSTAAILKYACQINNLKNVIVDNIALSDTEGIMFIEDDEEKYLRNTISKTTNVSSDLVQVQAITLDEYVSRNEIEKIDFLKVNIEGAEQLLIKGMTHSVKIIKNIAISCHDFRWAAGESEFYKTRRIILSFLMDNGFQVFERQTGDVILDSYLYGKKP